MELCEEDRTTVERALRIAREVTHDLAHAEIAAPAALRQLAAHAHLRVVSALRVMARARLEAQQEADLTAELAGDPRLAPGSPGWPGSPRSRRARLRRLRLRLFVTDLVGTALVLFAGLLFMLLLHTFFFR
jgi:hypothetical protein